MIDQGVPDHLRAGLKLVIVGINPGLRSGASGHHYASPVNHFWPLLYDAGLVPEPFTYADDFRMPDYGIGLTNLVERTTRQASELNAAEMKAGAERLRAKLLAIRPAIVCFNGKGIYEVFAARKKVDLGLQPEKLGDSLLFVMPSSSPRTAAYQRLAKLAYLKQLKELVDQIPAGVTP